MKNCFTFFAALLFFWAAAAQSEIGFSVYRDADGQISAQSAANLEAMVDMAKQAGFVRVWIGFDYPFQSDPALNKIRRQVAPVLWSQFTLIGPVWSILGSL